MERTKTWFIAVSLIVVGIVMLLSGETFLGLMLLLLGCAFRLID
jgi:hypothetical protein